MQSEVKNKAFDQVNPEELLRALTHDSDGNPAVSVDPFKKADMEAHFAVTKRVLNTDLESLDTSAFKSMAYTKSLLESASERVKGPQSHLFSEAAKEIQDYRDAVEERSLNNSWTHKIECAEEARLSGATVG